jgi:hypothetical protein
MLFFKKKSCQIRVLKSIYQENSLYLKGLPQREGTLKPLNRF